MSHNFSAGLYKKKMNVNKFGPKMVFIGTLFVIAKIKEHGKCLLIERMNTMRMNLSHKYNKVYKIY